MFVQVAGRYSSLIFVEKGNKKINAKSIMGVLSLGVKQGEKIFIFANGKDEDDAIAALEKLVSSEM
jgi:phosphotransferase system HPr (HPr) family protein